MVVSVLRGSVHACSGTSPLLPSLDARSGSGMLLPAVGPRNRSHSFSKYPKTGMPWACYYPMNAGGRVGWPGWASLQLDGPREKVISVGIRYYRMIIYCLVIAKVWCVLCRFQKSTGRSRNGSTLKNFTVGAGPLRLSWRWVRGIINDCRAS